MFGRINKLLQDSIMGKNLQEILDELPSGTITVQEGFLRSIPVSGTNCYISGRFDILTKLDDGTHALIDFKITTPDDEKVLKKYSTQLHAYKYALENPAAGQGEPIKVSQMGIISINPEEMKLDNGKVLFTTKPTWHPVVEDMDSFFSLIKDIDKVLAGDVPEVSQTCMLCVYRSKFIPAREDSQTEDIPF